MYCLFQKVAICYNSFNWFKELNMAVTEFCTPTHVYFGQGAELEVGKALKAFGAKNVLIHFGSGSVVKSGLLAKVEETLQENKIKFIEFGGAQPNPRLSLVRKGIELGKKEKVDFVLAVGGGSALDSAKAIALGIVNDCDIWDIYTKKKDPTTIVPFGVVLTLSATGSEMSNSSVITNDEITPYDKVGLNSELIRCNFAFMNPELTFSVSRYQTGSGSVDIMMHTLERYFHQGPSLELTDEYCALLLKSVIENAKIAIDDPTNYDARANLMWAGSVSHNGFNNFASPVGGDWACHRLEHELSALYDVAHGAGLAAIWGSWARYVVHNDYNRFAWLGNQVFGIKSHNVKRAAMRTIESFEDVFLALGMPTGLHELGLNLEEQDIKALAEKASWNGKRTLGNFQILQTDDMYRIFMAANKN